MFINNILQNVIKKTQTIFVGGSFNKFQFETKKLIKSENMNLP
ncbi:hypothetical protein Xhom_03463 [Xenorhabdus hominickii]|uniref:Uncharacterized protein n=1 Tax=Xenorhabdus hominickii TaxID=351679 RepID=A0A2G0Q2M9_XENHO|nr:hypothetical protein Xhom_03463 [Xenorhabdus hominickii]